MEIRNANSGRFSAEAKVSRRQSDLLLHRVFLFLGPWIESLCSISSDRVETIKKWNSKCALAEKFQRLVTVKRMVEAGANVAEQPFERQPLEIRRSADRAKRQGP